MSVEVNLLKGLYEEEHIEKTILIVTKLSQWRIGIKDRDVVFKGMFSYMKLTSYVQDLNIFIQCCNIIETSRFTAVPWELLTLSG